MEDLQLPAELQQLERDLSNRSRATTSANLRQRVLDGVQTQLRVERSQSRWQFAVAIAVAAMLWVNLSISVTQATNYGLRLDGDGQSIETLAGEIQHLVPELLAREATQEAILLQAGARIIPFPRLSVDYQTFHGEP